VTREEGRGGEIGAGTRGCLVAERRPAFRQRQTLWREHLRGRFAVNLYIRNPLKANPCRGRGAGGGGREGRKEAEEGDYPNGSKSVAIATFCSSQLNFR